MMETCACAEYKKPELTMIAFTMNHSVSTCLYYNCLIGGQEEVASPSYYFYYENGGTTYYIWYYAYSSTVDKDSINETYTSMLLSILKSYYATFDGSFEIPAGYTYDSNGERISNWHITEVSSTHDQYPS